MPARLAKWPSRLARRQRHGKGVRYAIGRLMSSTSAALRELTGVQHVGGVARPTGVQHVKGILGDAMGHHRPHLDAGLLSVPILVWA